MTAPIPPLAPRREAVDALLDRLARLNASAVTLRTTTTDMHGDGSPTSLLSVLDAIERDLSLASRETGRVRRGLAA